MSEVATAWSKKKVSVDCTATMSLQLSWFEKMTPQFMFITTTSSLV
jgi:hypothetical protein